MEQGNTSGGAATAATPAASAGQTPAGSAAPETTPQPQGSAAAATAAAGQQGNEADQGRGEPKPGPRDSGLVKRIGVLTRQKYELAARLEALEKLRSEGGGGGQQQIVAGAPKAPNINDFSDFNAYVDAMVEYRVQQGLAKTQEHAQRQTHEVLTRQQQEAIGAAWQESVQEYAETVPDFEEVVMSADVDVSQPLMRAIMEADEGPAVLYYLAQNPKEVRKLNSMSASAVTRHIGRLEERLTATKTQRSVSRAPKPPEPVNGSGTVNSAKDPADSLPIGDWMTQERERVKKKFGRT